MILGKGWLNMANRIKVVCTRILKTENILHGSPGILGSEYDFSHPGAVRPSVTLLGNFPTEFELGKEYHIDFSKVIAPRKSQVGLHAGDEGYDPNYDVHFVRRIAGQA